MPDLESSTSLRYCKADVLRSKSVKFPEQSKKVLRKKFASSSDDPVIASRIKPCQIILAVPKLPRIKAAMAAPIPTQSGFRRKPYPVVFHQIDCSL